MNAVATTEHANPFGKVAAMGSSSMGQSDNQRAIAEVQAALFIARANPRDPVAAMDRILNACTRPTLAASALYSYGRGGAEVTGPSIRLAEAIAQQWGNIQFGFREMSRGVDETGVGYSEVEAFAWDIESNTKRPAQFRVRHWRDTKSGGYKIKEERDVYELVANMAQRRVRACILAVIPGDVVETAQGQCETTLKISADTSPEAMAKMIEAFEPFGVTKEMIEKRIQRRLDAIAPAQVVSLKKIYASLRDGMSSAAEWFETNDEAGNGKTVSLADIKNKQPAKPKADQPPSFAQLADRLNKTTDPEVQAIILDEGRHLPVDQQAELAALAKK